MFDDSDIDLDVAADGDEIAEAYEEQLAELIQEVEEPDEDAERGGIDLAGIDRRDFMKAGAAVGGASALSGCQFGSQSGKTSTETSPANVGGGGTRTQAATSSHVVAPGEHDEYYGFWSGGHSGEMRVVGLPSMRPLMRIPVFQREGARGFGHDAKTKQVLREGGDVSSRIEGGYEWGDSHHPVLSETGGDYDGKYVFINDKGNGRMARVNLKYFETDAITDIPNMQACHGCAVQSPDTKYVYGIGEFRHPVPNDGTTDPSKSEEYWSVFAALDPESMEVQWQVRVTGNLDNADAGKEGKWAFATGYNKEEAFEIQNMTHDDRDYLKAFNVPAIENAISNGEAEEINGVPVLDGRKGSSLNSGSDPIVKYVPVPKSPHGCDVEPQGRYVTASGKLSPTVTIIDIQKLGQVSDPAKAIVGQPRVGLGPLHTTWDGRGHAYTTLFIDSQIAKWDIEKAVNAEKGSKEPVLGKVNVHYNPGHLQAAEAETTNPSGDWLVSLNKLSKDRFLPVGPIHPDNDQLIDISEDKPETQSGGMKLVADEPVYPEPHDCVIAHRDKINPNVVWDKADYQGEKPYISEEPNKAGIERTGDRSVHVKMWSKRSEFGLRDFTVKEGDEVTMTVTNIETSRDIIHGVAIPQHGINLAVAPQDTRQVTFTADEPGVYWIYCTYFCSALHLEMRSRMIVEPREG